MLQRWFARIATAAMCFGLTTCAMARDLLHQTATVSARTADASMAEGGQVSDLPLFGSTYQRVLYLPPSRDEKGLMIMFAGGTGELDIEKNGRIKNAKNFVVRSSDLWRDRGYGVLLVDAIDHRSLRGQRSSESYGEVIAKIVGFAHETTRAPLWVLGTSQGSIAAMHAASQAGEKGIAGLILTESVSIQGGSHETVFDAHPENVRVPALVVANSDDQCKVAPPSMADAIAQSIRNAPVTVMKVSGGEQRSQDTCGSLSPHGYYGIEENVVDGIIGWMKKARP